MTEPINSSPRHSVAIITPTLGMMRVEVAMAMQKAVFPMSIVRTIGTIKGRTTSEARNLAMKTVYADKIEFLMFWDDDIIPHDVAAPAKLMNVMLNNPQVSAVGAVYPRKIATTREPIVFKDRGETAWWGWRDGRVHEVYMSGTGFMILRVNDIAKMEVEAVDIGGDEKIPDLFRTTEEDDLRQTDDFYFAELCYRNKKRIFVHGGVLCEQIEKNGQVFQVGPPPDILVEKEEEERHGDLRIQPGN